MWRLCIYIHSCETKSKNSLDPGIAHQFKLWLRHLQSVNMIHREQFAKLLKDSRYFRPKGLGIQEGRENFVDTVEEVDKDIATLCRKILGDDEDKDRDGNEGNDAVFAALSTVAPLDV